MSFCAPKKMEGKRALGVKPTHKEQFGEKENKFKCNV